MPDYLALHKSGKLRAACRFVVTLLDLDPQRWWFDSWCSLNKI